jgi:hypothetical protein
MLILKATVHNDFVVQIFTLSTNLLRTDLLGVKNWYATRWRVVCHP